MRKCRSAKTIVIKFPVDFTPFGFARRACSCSVCRLFHFDHTNDKFEHFPSFCPEWMVYGWHYFFFASICVFDVNLLTNSKHCFWRNLTEPLLFEAHILFPKECCDDAQKRSLTWSQMRQYKRIRSFFENSPEPTRAQITEKWRMKRWN